MTATALASGDYARVVARVRGIRARYRPPAPSTGPTRLPASRWRALALAGALWLLLLSAPLAIGVRTQADMTDLPVADAGTPLRSPFAPAPRDLLVRTATLVPQARLAAIAGTVEVAAWSPDGRFLASGYSSGALLVWDLAHHRLAGSVPRAHRRFVSALSWSPDGRTLVSAADGAAIVWRVGADGSLTRLRTLPTAPTRIVAAAISPRGALLALADGRHGVVLWTLHDLTSGRQGRGAFTPRQTLPVRGRTTALAWSSDGTRLAVGTLAGDVVSWRVDPRPGRLMAREADAHLGSAIYALGWAPGRAVLAVGSANGVVRLVSPALHPLQVLLTPFHGRPVLQVPDYGTPGGGGVARSVRSVGGPSINALSWSPRGDLLGVTAVGVPLRLWQPASGTVVATYRDNWDMNAIAWHPNGALLAVATDDGSIRMLRATLGASDVAALLCRLGGAGWCAPLGRSPGDHHPFAPTSYMSR